MVSKKQDPSLSSLFAQSVFVGKLWFVFAGMRSTRNFLCGPAIEASFTLLEWSASWSLRGVAWAD